MDRTVCAIILALLLVICGAFLPAKAADSSRSGPITADDVLQAYFHRDKTPVADGRYEVSKTLCIPFTFFDDLLGREIFHVVPFKLGGEYRVKDGRIVGADAYFSDLSGQGWTEQKKMDVLAFYPSSNYTSRDSVISADGRVAIFIARFHVDVDESIALYRVVQHEAVCKRDMPLLCAI